MFILASFHFIYSLSCNIVRVVHTVDYFEIYRYTTNIIRSEIIGQVNI